MSQTSRPMRSSQSDTPFALAYLLVLAIQFPVWLFAGMLWAAFMIVLVGAHPLDAVIGGMAWGFFMWVSVGTIFAIGIVWRRSAEFRVPDRAAFRTALEWACSKRRLIVLAETAEEIVLGPKWALVRFRLQEVRIEFAGGTAVLSAPALALGPIRKTLQRELKATAAHGQASQQQPDTEQSTRSDRPH